MKNLLNNKPFQSIIFLIILITVCFNSSGQTVPVKNPEQYLYTEFTRAKVATKVGNDLYINANYNVITEMMVFLQRGNVYDMVDYHNVDTIYFNNATFIPGEKAFYEVAVKGPLSLLIRHMGSIMPHSKPAAYGGTSEVSSANYISNMKLGNDVYRLQKDTSLLIKQSESYLLSTGKAIIPFSQQSQFIAAVPELRNEIKAYIRENKIKFSSGDDIIKLVNYCNSLKK